MTIDPGFDKWVWLVAAIFAVVLGARAWVVETSRTRPGQTSVAVRTFTGLTLAVLALLVVMLAIQGGSLLVHSIVTGTDPTTGLPIGADPVPAPADPQLPADPAAPGAAVPNPAPAAPAANGG